MMRAHQRLAICLCIALALVFCVSKGNAHENVPQYTLREVLQQVYVDNPTLRAAREELKATAEGVPQALAGWRPTIASEVSVSASDVEGSNFGGGDGSTAKDVVVSVDQPIFRGGQTLAETRSARKTLKAQAALLKSEEQNILLSAATAFMDVLRDQALLDLEKNNKELIAEQNEASQLRFEVGELTKTDVAQSRARLAAAEAAIVSAHGDLRRSKAVFEQYVGFAAGDLVKPENLNLQLPDSLDEGVARAEYASPEVMVSEFMHHASEEDIGSVFAELLPSVGLFGSWNKTLDPTPGILEDQTTQVIGLSASIPLYSAGGTRSRVRQAKYTANQRYLETLEVRRQVKQKAVSHWETWQAARAEIDSRQAQVEATKLAQEGMRIETNMGSRTVLDSLDADQELLDAQVSLVEAQRNEIVARFSLAAVLGQLTPETLGFSHESIHLNDKIEKITRSVFSTNVDRLGDSK